MTDAYTLFLLQIVVAATLKESSVLDAMFDKLNRNFPAAKIQCVPRRYMNENKGVEYIRRLCSPDSTGVDIALKSKLVNTYLYAYCLILYYITPKMSGLVWGCIG